MTLLRLGEGKEVIELSEGATLADLLRITGLNARDCEILVDGRPIEDCSMLQTGMIVSVGARLKQAVVNPSWRDSIGDFHNDPAFEDMMERVKAEREAEKQTS